MRFHWHDNDCTLKEVLEELLLQYHDNFQYLGVNQFNEVIKPNIQLLEMVIDELKDEGEEVS